MKSIRKEIKRKFNDPLPEGLKLLKVKYLRDYVYRFEFSDGVVSEVNFKKLLHGEYEKYLDVIQFKKLTYTEYGDIYWWPNLTMMMGMESYYGQKSVRNITEDEITMLMKREGMGTLRRGLYSNIVIGNKVTL